MARGKTYQIRQTAPTHITWKQIKTYKALYRNKDGVRITIRSITEPPRTRTFRTGKGIRKFKLYKLYTSNREVIIVARTKNRKKAVDQDELEEIEALEELEELEDEDELEEEDEDVEEDEDEEEDEEDEGDEEEPEDEEDEDEDEEEEPAPKSRKKGKVTVGATRKKTVTSRNGDREGVGTQEVAKAAGIDGRALRILLRKHNIPKDEDSGQYRWASLKSPQVVKIIKLAKGGAAKAAQREQLENLKAHKAKKTASTTTTKRTSTKAAPAKKTATRRTKSRA